jgi:nucleoid-associated protein YgaU
MNLIKLFGVSVLVLGLAACGEADKAASTEDAGHAADAAATTQDAVQETAAEAATEVEEAVKTEAISSAERVSNKFDTEKFGEGTSGDVSTAPAPSFFLSENLKPGEYINEQGETVMNRDVETAVENDKLRQIPEGIEPGSVEHTMWLLDQEE